MRLNDLVQRAEALIHQGDELLVTRVRGEWGADRVETGAFGGFRAACLSFLHNLYGDNHPYYTDFDRRCDTNTTAKARVGREIIAAVQAELLGGWLNSARDLALAEIYANFLEMARGLLEQKSTDAAAIVTGGVLEEHLRQLCARHGISTTTTVGAATTPRSADALNDALALATVYNKLDQQCVAAWLRIRDRAVRGERSERGPQEAETMHHAVADFTVRQTR